jgi:hypothetical protein
MYKLQNSKKTKSVLNFKHILSLFLRWPAYPACVCSFRRRDAHGRVQVICKASAPGPGEGDRAVREDWCQVPSLSSAGMHAERKE